MESDLLYPCHDPLLDSFIHSSECSRSGALLDFDTELFSGNVLDPVSEDLVAELEDGDLFPPLGSNGISCETPLSSQNGDRNGRPFSSSKDENSDMLHSLPRTSSNNLNGFCNPSLNLEEVPQIEEVTPDSGEGGEGVTALGSWRRDINNLPAAGTRMAIHQLNRLSLDCKGERKSFVKVYSLDGLGDRRNVLYASSPFDMSSAQVSLVEQAETELSIPSFVAPGKHDISGHSDEDSQDVGGGVSAFREASSNSAIDISLSGLSAAANSMGSYEINAMKAPLVEDESSEPPNDVLFTSADLERKPACNLDYPDVFQRVDIEGDSLSPLPTPGVQFSQPRVMQRSFSSHALGQLGGRALKERRMEPSLLTQTAPLYSSVRLGVTSSQPQVHLKDVGQTEASGPPFNSMRRVFSTGDIQTLNGMQMVQEAGSPLHSDSTMSEEGAFKIGRYTLEERKSRICRYRQKRNERNFSKKIKYACRKTLADSRPRIRGRFAKNEEVDDILLRQSSLHSQEDEDEQLYLQQARYWRQL